MASPPSSPDPIDPPEGAANRGPGSKRRWLGRSLKVLASAVLLLGLVEGGLRVVLFTDLGGLGKKAARLRSASNFAHRWSPEYWKLLRLFIRGERKDRRYDPIVGWMHGRVESGTYDHRDHDPQNGKRPVLLYGDSFAGCETGPEDCWEGLLARSEFGDTHQLLNYGTGGFGLDQTYILLRESIGNYVGESPLVIVSVLVDDDLDRSILPFRSWPKPRLEIGADGALEFDGPVHEDTLEYLEENPPAIRSYLWRYLLYGTDLIPGPQRNRWSSKGETFEDARRLNRRILEEIRSVLDGSGVESFVLLFHGKGFFRADVPETWREGFLVQELERLRMPYVSSRTAIDEDIAATGRSMEDYFQLKGNGKGHYDAEGNRVVFEAIQRGMRGAFEGTWPQPDTIDAPSALSATASGAFARHGTKAMRPFLAAEDTPRWVLAAGPEAPTELTYHLYGQVDGFSAVLKPVPAQSHRNDGPIALTLVADGIPVLEYELVPSSEPIPIEIDLGGVRDFRIQASSPAGKEGVVLLLASPQFLTR